MLAIIAHIHMSRGAHSIFLRNARNVENEVGQHAWVQQRGRCSDGGMGADGGESDVSGSFGFC